MTIIYRFEYIFKQTFFKIKQLISWSNLIEGLFYFCLCDTSKMSKNYPISVSFFAKNSLGSRKLQAWKFLNKLDEHDDIFISIFCFILFFKFAEKSKDK
jgi:hypothetical protein